MTRSTIDRKELARIVARHFGEDDLSLYWNIVDGEFVGVVILDRNTAKPEPTPAAPAISFGEGEKIYDQGWNDGIDQFRKNFAALITIRGAMR